jgi:methyltransferase-like protein/SAM-dependent methyltransferase
MPAPKAAQKIEHATSYDEVPYESFTYGQTHPAHMTTIARLFGLNPPDFRKARVLELGCASGGNLLPLALLYPEASFTGLDLSQEQIAEANASKKTLKLGNIDFQQQDILAFDLKTHQEKFDYIIVHGVFSWVPEPVRQKILELCQSCLSPDGLALVSYNTLPGWNAVRSLREMMQYHVSRFSSASEKIMQARALLEFLAESVPEGRAGYRDMIDEERNMLKNLNDSYLFHDHLENTNAQFYFHDFARMAADHDLLYVGDSSLASMFVGNMPQKALDVLKTVNDVVRQEQYMDFITNRRFRTSILCRKGRPINRSLPGTKILDFYLTSAMKPEAANVNPKKDIVFKTANGASFTTHTEIAGQLYLALSESGIRPVAARDLIAGVQKTLKLGDTGDIERTLIQHGLQLALRGFIGLHSDSPDFTASVSRKPKVFAMARHQAGMKNCRSVTSVLGAMVTTDAASNIIIQNLDGTRTVDDIIDIMAGMAESGKLTISRDNKPTRDQSIIREEIARVVDQILPKLAKQALLVK